MFENFFSSDLFKKSALPSGKKPKDYHCSTENCQKIFQWN